MKKFSFFLNCAATALFAIAMTACQAVEDNPSSDPIVVAIGNGSSLNDLIANFAKDNKLSLPAGAEITIDETVNLEAPLTIIGDKENPVKIKANAGFVTNSNISFKNVVIDAENLTTPFIQLANVTLVGDEKAKAIDEIAFIDSKISNLKYQFIYANKQAYLVDFINVLRSVIAIDGSKKKTIFDFNGGGNVHFLGVDESTIYANPTNGQNGGFFSSQSGKEVTDLGGEKWFICITRSTLYNITNGKTVNTLRKNSQTYQKYIVKNNVVVDCGKSAQFLKGLNAGQPGKDTNWDVDGNCFNFGGAVVAEQKIGSANENIKNSIDAVVAFADAANGDFTQSNVKAGDPRWIK